MFPTAPGSWPGAVRPILIISQPRHPQTQHFLLRAGLPFGFPILLPEPHQTEPFLDPQQRSIGFLPILLPFSRDVLRRYYRVASHYQWQRT